ncbi:MAG: hypothetical protein J2P17_21385, partial [Mycobacterium sp.]|nr:hypothetical protein [Mycobacterium sp.]
KAPTLVPSGFVFDVIEPTWISVALTPGAVTVWCFEKSEPVYAVTGPPDELGLELPLLPLLALLHATATNVTTTAKQSAPPRLPATRLIPDFLRIRSIGPIRCCSPMFNSRASPVALAHGNRCVTT